MSQKTFREYQNDIEYSIVRTDRRTLAVLIRRNGSVEVRAPFRIPDADINKFIISRADWIKKHSLKNAERHNTEKKSYTNGGIHFYLGKTVPLRIVNTGKNRISFNGHQIDIETKSVWTPDKGEKLINTLYRKLAMEVYSHQLALLLVKFKSYNFRPTGLKVRTTVSRWGSCSAKGAITLSSHLLKKRVELIDYVILHELCHLVHRNHGRGYYKLLEEVCPDYKKLKKELREIN